MNIGFDLDKIFINTPPFVPNWLIDKLYKQKDNGELLYRIPGKFEQRIRKISHVSLLRPPIPQNLKELESIAQNKKYSAFLISSRFGFLRKNTEKIVSKYKLDKYFKRMYFNLDNSQPHMFKNNVIQKEDITLYVDDDLSLLRYLAKENPNRRFFWLNSKKNGKLRENLFAITKIKNILTL